MLVESIKGDRCCSMNHFDFDGYEEMGVGGGGVGTVRGSSANPNRSFLLQVPLYLSAQPSHRSLPVPGVLIPVFRE